MLISHTEQVMLIVGCHFALGRNEKGTIEIAISLLTKETTHYGHAIFACPLLNGGDRLTLHGVGQAGHIHGEPGGEGLREDG